MIATKTARWLGGPWDGDLVTVEAGRDELVIVLEASPDPSDAPDPAGDVYPPRLRRRICPVRLAGDRLVVDWYAGQESNGA